MGMRAQALRATQAFRSAVVTAFLLSAVTAWGQGGELAKVNGRPILRSDLDATVAGLGAAQRQNVMGDYNSRRQLLSSLIDQELLVQQSVREKLDQEPQYRRALDAFRKQYLSARWVEKNLANQLSPTAAKAHYQAYRSRYSTDQIEAQHILLADEKSARDVLKLATAPGADFMVLAEKYSIDPSAKNNRGDLGLIQRESPFVQEFKDAAFEAAEGEVVGPVRTSYGYHLIRVKRRIPGRMLGYDEVEARVTSDLRQELIQERLLRLRKTAKITINEAALRAK